MDEAWPLLERVSHHVLGDLLVISYIFQALEASIGAGPKRISLGGVAHPTHVETRSVHILLRDLKAFVLQGLLRAVGGFPPRLNRESDGDFGNGLSLAAALPRGYLRFLNLIKLMLHGHTRRNGVTTTLGRAFDLRQYLVHTRLSFPFFANQAKLQNLLLSNLLGNFVRTQIVLGGLLF